MNGPEHSGEPGASQTPRDRFGASYLAMDAAQKKGSPSASTGKRRRAGRTKRIIFWLLAAGGVLYFQRERVLPWLAGNAITAPAYKAVVEKFRPAENPARLPLTSRPAGLAETGGTTTFSSGSGSWTVSSDDGSESFRVVVPPSEGGP